MVVRTTRDGALAEFVEQKIVQSLLNIHSFV